MPQSDHQPPRRRVRPCPAAATDRSLRLLSARRVPLTAEQEQRAVSALAGLLAGLFARQGAVPPVLEVQPGGEVSSADMATHTPTEGQL